MFAISYETLSPKLKNLGRAALLPWDVETFGFNVAQYELGKLSEACPVDMRPALDIWAEARQVKLISTTVEADHSKALGILQQAGFRYVDTSLVAFYPDLEALDLPPSKIDMTPARSEDLPLLQEMAAGAFRHGRYHADPCFPNHLADRRYRDWLTRSFSGKSPQEPLIARHNGAPCGFIVIQIENGAGDLALIALDKSSQGQGLGASLVASTLRAFRQRGARSIRSTISAANTGILNLHEKMGARHVDPKVVLHWRQSHSTVNRED